MILQNNYIILDDENIKIFKYKHIPNFSFSFNFTKSFDTPENEIILNKNCVDELIENINYDDFINYIKKIMGSSSVIFRIYDQIINSASINSFLTSMLYHSFISIEDNDKSYECLLKLHDKLLEYFTNNNLLDRDSLRNLSNEEYLKSKDFINQILKDLKLDNDSPSLELIKLHFTRKFIGDSYEPKTEINIGNYYCTGTQFINNLKVFIDNYNYFRNTFKKYVIKNESQQIYMFFLAKLSHTFKKLIFNKYIDFLSDKNLLIFNKYDKNIDIEKDINFINNELKKCKFAIINERVRKKILPFINKKVSNGEYLGSLVLLNYILALQGNDVWLGTTERSIGFWDSAFGDYNFNSFEIEEIVFFYFRIFKEMEEYEIIIKHSYLIDYDIKALQLVCDSCIEVKNYSKANEILNKIELYEPSLKYINTTRNKILREEKMDSFSEKNDKIDFMSGIDFEELLTNKFNELGFFAEQTKGSGDFGADIIVETKLQTKIIIQCKRFKSKVNLKAVQEVIGAVGHFEGDIGIVITNNEFLNSAKKLAKSNDIELWDRDRLSKFLSGDISFSILNEI